MPSRSIIRTGVGPHREPRNRFPAMAAAINLLAARAARVQSRRNLSRSLSPKLDHSHSITRFDRSRTGPYGITATPAGDIYYASLAGNHIARVDRATGEATVIEPPTPNQGARRVWSDSQGRIWVSEWSAGQLGLYDPETKQWKEWKLPGRMPQTYAVYVDERDMVWVSDWGADVILSFDPRTEQFTPYPMSGKGADVRQILGRSGEVWLPESATSRLMVIRTGASRLAGCRTRAPD